MRTDNLGLASQQLDHITFLLERVFEEKTVLLVFIIRTTVSFVQVKPLIGRPAMLMEAKAGEKSERRLLDEVSHLRELFGAA